MRSFIIIAAASCCLTLALATPRTARADEPKPALYFTPGMVGAFTTDGKGLPPVALQTVIGTLPLNERWSLLGKAGYATPFTAFQPAPHFQAGASYRIGDGFRLGGTALYRYVPHWSGTPSDTHLLGAVLVPTFPVAKTGILLQLPTGTAYNTHADQWSLFTGVELAIPLPL